MECRYVLILIILIDLNFTMQENQLLRDRKKNTKKRLSTGDNNTSVPNITNQVRASGHDNRAVKVVLLDSQSSEKVGTGKGSLFKRHASIGMSRTNCKGDQAAMKTVKHRRKNGNWTIYWFQQCYLPFSSLNFLLFIIPIVRIFAFTCLCNLAYFLLLELYYILKFA